ncbi:CRISPR-associated protein Csx16 [Sulfuricystis multivorans]|uniref:CRISPR-associated protein Csx16 n=1 Tax=Sulfuricystis multivorans TaxID=2211108 RepID=UPI000F84A497|nr:CRISPR-associated protein Csx16 [Sulfuricystis multivorans]
MTTYFVSRHPGALDWARAAQVAFDVHVPHLDPGMLQAGDVVIGSLPVHLAAQVCARGARYFNLSLDLPAHLRGQELDAQTLKALDARLEEYVVAPTGKTLRP